MLHFHNFIVLPLIVFSNLIPIMIILIIFVTGFIDAYKLMIHDYSWMSLILIKALSNPKELYLLCITLLSCMLCLQIMNVFLWILTKKHLFAEGDLFFITSLTAWLGLEQLDLLLGLTSSMMIIYQSLMLIRYPQDRWSSIRIPMSPFLGLSYMVLALK
jgi:hypothetical protein